MDIDKKDIRFKQISYRSAEYETSLQLRERILRAPINCTLSAKDTEAEGQQSHFGIFYKSQLVACVVIKPYEKKSALLRQMAVDENYQGQNIGRQLLQYAEETLVENGYSHIKMAARKTAIGFYTKLGYTAEGDFFLKLHVPHIKMHKNI